MKLLCLWYERTLARLAVEGQKVPTGSRLDAHLAHCPDCRRTREDFTLLASELPDALSDPLALPTFQMPLLTRRATGTPALRLSFATLALSGLLLAAFAGARMIHRSGASSPNPDSGQLSKLPTPPSAGERPGGPKEQVTRTTALAVAQTNSSRHLPSSVPETAMPALTTVPFEYAPLARADTSQGTSETVTPEAWGGLGAWCAANGDYVGAADAYARAYKEQPDPDFALAAGQSAETAGDMNDALDYYLQALKMSTESQSYPEEDEPWNEMLVIPSSEPCSL